MAVLIEGISVVIKARVVAEKYPGGWAGFRQDAPLKAVCTDDELVGLAFMVPDDVKAFMDDLSNHEIHYVVDGMAADMVVVDQQRGFLARCEWAQFGRLALGGDQANTVTICFMNGSTLNAMVAPDGWSFESSLSRNFKFVKTGWEREFLEFVRSEGGVDIYRDLETGKEGFVERTQRAARGRGQS